MVMTFNTRLPPAKQSNFRVFPLLSCDTTSGSIGCFSVSDPHRLLVRVFNLSMAVQVLERS